ncbi:MAG: UvrB/UvrC motif-containing protein, partial [Eubacteriales bacterium]
EEFERAVEIRDRIRELEKDMKQGGKQPDAGQGNI